MNGLVILLISAAVLFLAYLVYGRWLAKKWGVDPAKPTPAHVMEDGIDYVPTRPSVVFGHEFASIAGAGPINGPIQAAMFGWLPVLLWIIFGGIFFGAVQDFAALYASIKNKGKTIGYIIETYIGRTGKRLFLIFVWLFSILVVAAFADIVAGTFAGFSKNADGGLTQVSANASVATTSILFVVAAVFLGFVIRKIKISGIATGFAALMLLVACIALGLAKPIYVQKEIWLYIVFAYIFIASIAPVWALLQPRDYLNSFLLVAMIGAAFIGIVFTAPVINLPAFTAFKVGNNYLFPMLFVTVACGAVSGFHSLVASGTVSKQLDNEKHMLPIGFGSMLVESLLAVLALIAAGSLAVNGEMPKGTPPQIFAQAVAGFLMQLGLPENIIFTLITLSVSAFALTSLDSVARVGRLAFQELFTEDQNDGKEPSAVATFFSGKVIATIATLILGYALAIMGYANVWPLFGSANQLLAALALISCAVFLKKTKRQGTMLWVPMFIMLAVTFTALVFSIRNNLKNTVAFLGGMDGINITGSALQLVFGVLLLGLGIVVAVQGIAKLREKENT
jgi:carbon starvation protein